MKPAFAILASVFCMASVATAQPQPSGPAPVFKVVTSIDRKKGHIVLLETVAKVIPVQKEIVLVLDGIQVKQVVTVFELAYEKRETLIDATKSRVITPDGKQLPIDEAWKRLKKNMVVADSGDGKAPAQEYLRALSAETLIIISPPPITAPPPVIAPPKQ